MLLGKTSTIHSPTRLPGTPSTTLTPPTPSATRAADRDSILVTIALGSFLYAATLWFLPAFTEHVATEYAFDLVPFHSAIVSAFCVLGPPLLLGAVLALQLLDDRWPRCGSTEGPAIEPSLSPRAAPAAA
jgi:hypothetical protein